MTDLPVAGPASPELINKISDLADAITTPSSADPSNVRVGIVTELESVSPFRARLDITGTAWLSRSADATINVGDRVWAVQQGEVTVIAGRLSPYSNPSPIGVVEVFAGSTAPSGWLMADGSAVSRTTYAALFAVCGTTYGAGDGSTTFNLPNLVSKIPVGSGGTYARGATGGSATTSLSTSNLPAHDHGSAGNHGHTASGTADAVGDHVHSYTVAGSRSDILAGGGTTVNNGGSSTSTGGGGGHSHGVSVSVDSGGTHTHASVGSGTSFSTMPPYVAMSYIIRAY